MEMEERIRQLEKGLQKYKTKYNRLLDKMTQMECHENALLMVLTCVTNYREVHEIVSDMYEVKLGDSMENLENRLNKLTTENASLYECIGRQTNYKRKYETQSKRVDQLERTIIELYNQLEKKKAIIAELWKDNKDDTH